jgi:8-oxo-dGTP pyrophosphatase MutT (NUDIX family)
MSLRQATTVLLLRPATDGFELFMVQRHRRSGFLPNAWVFPGGRVDDGDALLHHPRVIGGDALLPHIGDARETAAAFAIAGVRETFEEAGIWLGSGDLPWDLREPLGRGQANLAAVLDEHDATIDLDRLRPWSWWITPEVEPKRYDTRFLVANAEGLEGEHDDREVVDSGWYSPSKVLAEASHGGFPMAPPTWWTLFELSRHKTLDEVMNAAESRPNRSIQPLLSFDDHGVHLRLPGHPDHPDAAIQDVATQIEFEQGQWAAYLNGAVMPLPR